MKSAIHLSAVLWLGCLAGIAPAAAQDDAAILRDAIEANVQPVADATLDTVFAVPDLDLSPYTAVMLEPVTVSYEREAGPMYRLTRADMEDLQRHARAALEAQLSGDGGYGVVDEPGPGTLIVRASLQNVRLTFPQGAENGQAKALADFAVRMSLEAELIDSRTNQVLMIVADRQVARLSNWPRRTVGAEAWAQADRAFNYWAKVLRQRLDGARGQASR